MRWVGIDEAGYGPNLGPLVMTAVIAEGQKARVPANAEPTPPPGPLARPGGHRGPCRGRSRSVLGR